METNYAFSEHQVVLQQQEELVNEVEKFSEMEVLYSLQTVEEIMCALSSRMEKLNTHVAEYRRICSLMEPGYVEEMQSLFSSIENHVGVLERDKFGNLHCDNCLVAYKFGQSLVGKKVRISIVTLNANKMTRNIYPAFAKRIDVVEE